MADVPNYPQNTIVSDPNATTEGTQKWTLSGVGAAKKWTVEIDGEKAATAALVGNAPAATVQAELNKLSNISPGDVEVTGAAGGPYTVAYKPASRYANQVAPAPTFTAEEGTIASADLTVGGAATNAVQRGTGLADRTGETSALAGETPAAVSTANSGSKYR